MELEDTLASKPNENIVGVRLPPGAPFKRYNMTIKEFYNEYDVKIKFFGAALLVILGLGWAIVGLFWAANGIFPWSLFVNFLLWAFVAAGILTGIFTVTED